MAKAKIGQDSPVAKEPEGLVKIVDNIAEAEELQKDGWQVIDVTQSGKDVGGLTIKKYKLTKEE